MPHHTPPTTLIGRENERKLLRQWFRRDEVRLVTFTGAAGVGKTRLALQMMTDLAVDFPDGAYFVSLIPITDPELLLPTIAQSLGLSIRDDAPLPEQLAATLTGRQLLVLDNFEQITAAALLVNELLATHNSLKILVTSRALLRLSGEYEFAVLPLPTTEAVELFTRRAQAHKPEFDAAGRDAEIIADICRRLDGLPLAIELAAARVKLLPPRAMLSRLENRLSLLTGGPQDAPARHQSLRAALEWSFNLLELGEQRLFRRLSIFIVGGSLEAIEAVCNLPAEYSLNVLSLVQALMDKSLLRQEEALDGEPRLWMLESVREFALEQLQTSGEFAAVQLAHAAYFCAWAEGIEPHLFGPQQGYWLDRLEQELNNLRAVLRWATTSPDAGALAVGLRLGSALGRFWTYRGHLTEGYNRLAGLLARPEATDPALVKARAAALNAVGLLAISRSDYTAAGRLFETSLALWRELGDAGKQGAALALDSLGWVASAFGRFEPARDFYEASLALHREGDTMQTAAAANVLAHLGMAAFFSGDLDRARPVLEEGLAITQTLGDKWGAGFVIFHLGIVATAQGRFSTAQDYLFEGLAICAALNARLLAAFMLEALAWLAFARQGPNAPACAAQIFGAAEALRETLSAPRSPQWRVYLESIIHDLRARMGTEAFERENATGRQLAPEAAQALFMQLVTFSSRASSPLALSPREGEVLQLVAAGLTDAQVAEHLVVSVRTVNAHLQSIYNKLGVNSRTAAVRTATEQKLISPV